MTLGDLLNKLDKVKRLGNGEWEARCPSHEDRKPSLSIKAEGDRILVKCHTGCAVEAVCAALGLTVADLFLTPKTQASPEVHRRAPPTAQIAAEYSYTDESGAEVFQVVRLNPKSFRQRHKNGSGEWAWNLDGVRRVLYHLPEVVKTQALYLVEGEKDVDNLRALGLTATTSPGGAQAWRPEYASLLAGKDITLIPDRDGPGLDYARDVARDLGGKAQLSVILLPKPHKDITDWLEAGGDVKALPGMAQGIGALFTEETEKEGPEIKELIDGYRLEWKALGLVIGISHLREHSDGRLLGEIVMDAVTPMKRRLLTPENFNFLAGRSRADLVKRLEKDIPHRRTRDLGEVAWPWKELINTLCDEIQSRARRGEGLEDVYVSADQPVAAPLYLLEPMVLEGLPTLIYGEKAAAKSTLALVLYLCLTLPWEDNPLGLRVPERSTTTVILDYEQNRGIVEYYLHRLLVGAGITTPINLLYRRCRRPLAEDVAQIQGYLHEVNAEAVIIDSLGLAAGGDLLKSEAATGFAEALRALRVSSIILGQTSKSQDEKRKTPYGNTYFTYLSRIIWEVVKAEERSEGDDLHVALFQRWGNYGRTLKPFGVHYHYNDVGITVEREEVVLGDFRERANAGLAIMDALKRGPKTEKEIKVLTGIKGSSTVRVTLGRLTTAGKVLKLEAGNWGLAALT